MTDPKSDVKIFFPVDVSTEKEAREILAEVSPYVEVAKVGLEFMYHCDVSKAIALIKEFNLPVMVDSKLIDIGPTVAGGIEGILKHDIDYVNVMAVGGRPMVEQAVERVDNTFRKYGVKRPQIIAVTVLTSLKFEHLVELGIVPDREFLAKFGVYPPLGWKLPEDSGSQQDLINEIVLRWARVSVNAGADIVLSSALELPRLAEEFEDIGLINPGIRPPWSPPDHQGRKLSPYEAVISGAKNLVIGTPIRKPPKGMSREEAVKSIRADIARAENELRMRGGK